MQSGQPFSVSHSTSRQGSVSGRADRVRGQALYPETQTRPMWFNAGVFAAPAPYTYGNVAYSQMSGPGYQNWDLSLAKHTVLTEAVRLDVRMDVFSMGNPPNFGLPGSAVSNPAKSGVISSTTGAARTVSLGVMF